MTARIAGVSEQHLKNWRYRGFILAEKTSSPEGSSLSLTLKDVARVTLFSWMVQRTNDLELAEVYTQCWHPHLEDILQREDRHRPSIGRDFGIEIITQENKQLYYVVETRDALNKIISDCDNCRHINIFGLGVLASHIKLAWAIATIGPKIVADLKEFRHREDPPYLRGVEGDEEIAWVEKLTRDIWPPKSPKIKLSRPTASAVKPVID